MSYHFNKIEEKWQKYWAQNQTFKASNTSSKEKFYVLDMFPYPSGAGLHVGHPLGYIASDIYARYKRHKGFNVLHPQGYDSFGLPAEQYAIQTGQHPAVTTEDNINRYREQLDQIGFSFDWSREVRTSDPEYYKWTQWIFLQLFESWYDNNEGKARSITDLEQIFSAEGNKNINAACDEDIEIFSAEDWNAFSTEDKREVLLKYRLTYLAETEVNWVPQLGTVLANDEIVNGVSERGGYPVVRKKMTQWSMRISAYAERLRADLDKIDWSESLKESQRNWIGKSVGAMVEFPILTFPEGEGTLKPKYMTGGNNSKLLLEKAIENRANPTQAEKIMWDELKSKALGHKFRQQHLIDDFIVDFVCLSKKLVIEVDGGYHAHRQEKDLLRTQILKERGFRVIRFSNEEVIGEAQQVVEKVKKELEKIIVPPSGVMGIPVFTTRPDTIFGVTFMTIAPEHELVARITTPEQKTEVEAYVQASAKRSERERMADVKTISGVFTGAYAEHPFTKEPVPIWIGDYVLAGYGTGAVMAVPCGDQRDYDFAKHFNIPIKNIFKDVDISEEAFTGKENAVIADSDFLTGLPYKEALPKSIEELEKIGQGKGKTNYRLRDAVFSRQRYWGEPFPIYYKNGQPYPIPEECLPLELPQVEKYLPTEEGEPPLGRATKWHWDEENKKVVSVKDGEKPPSGVWGIELNTMPGWAGSSWYFFRYMDVENQELFVSQEAQKYWENVDLYIGGSEHATGHLLYSRFWTKFLYDRGMISVEEPFKKLINQGMILGQSAFVKRLALEFIYVNEGQSGYSHEVAKEFRFPYILISEGFFKSSLSREKLKKIIRKDLYKKLSISDQKYLDESKYELTFSEEDKIHVDVSLVNLSDEMDVEAFKNWRPEYKDAIFITEDFDSSPSGRRGGAFIVSREVEKMSKSKYNVVNPDEICKQYGADTLRMYEMFLGPLEQAKPWNTAGITGVHSFLKKLWKLYHSPSNSPEGGGHDFLVSEDKPSAEALKTLHKTIKKVTEDIEAFSFNTSVSTFMICVNELNALKCNSRQILEPLVILLAPYAPHIAEELWEKLGHSESVSTATYPVFEEKYLVESKKLYPVSFNGKMRFTLELPLDLNASQIEEAVMGDERTQRQLEGRTPKKVIIVPGKIVNIVG